MAGSNTERSARRDVATGTEMASAENGRFRDTSALALVVFPPWLRELLRPKRDANE